jgi:outer membrane lipoprotein-sorting protein
MPQQPRITVRHGRVAAACLTALALLGLSGCASMRAMMPRQQVACTLPKNPSVDEIVAHINANVNKVEGYRASSLKIRANNLPLGGNLVVERDHRLRLEVTSLAGKEVDLGSNDEVFWIWAKRNQPAGVYYAAHDDMDVARQNLPIPFEPEWLMEALGVVPLSTENVHMEGEAQNGAIRLVSHHELSSGQTVRKVVVVNSCTGCVMEHSTYDAQGQPLVRVLLQDYRPDPTTGAMLARHVKLDWPQADMSLAMSLGHVEVNPPPMPAAVWEMPQVPGCPLVNLGDPRLSPARSIAREDTPQAPTSRPRPKLSTIASSDPDFRAPDAVGSRGGRGVPFEEPLFLEPIQPSGAREPAISSLPTIAPF